MRAVAEGFLLGFAAIAEGDTVAGLEGFAIRAFDGDVAGSPQRALNGALRGDLGGDGDLHGIIRFDVFALFIHGVAVGARGTAINHGHDLGTHLGFGGIGDHLFDVGDAIAAET